MGVSNRGVGWSMWHWRDGAVEGNGGEKARVRALAGASGVRG